MRPAARGASLRSMLCTVGDLVEDVVVLLSGPPRRGSDVDARVSRHRGGSAANVAVHAARLRGRARFVGQVGDDATGQRLIEELEAAGVQVRARRGGATGAIVVLVEPGGERTMLSDRGASTQLAEPDPSWLDGVEVLHVPAYSLVVEPLASAARVLVEEAHRRALHVSVDASSAAVLETFGASRFLALLEELRPAVLFASADEAEVLVLDRAPRGVQLALVKRGAEPTRVLGPDGVVTEVAVPHVAAVLDTTGAGDAFAAGVLCADAGDVAAAVRAGHAAAAAVLSRAGAS